MKKLFCLFILLALTGCGEIEPNSSVTSILKKDQNTFILEQGKLNDKVSFFVIQQYLNDKHVVVEYTVFVSTVGSRTTIVTTPYSYKPVALDFTLPESKKEKIYEYNAPKGQTSSKADNRF